MAGGLETPRVILVNPIGAPALEGPRGILTRLAVFYYWAGAKLPKRLGDALLRNRAIVRVMSVSMAKTRDPELRRFIHDQHHTYFGRFASRQSVVDGFDASVSYTIRDFAEKITMPTILIGAEKDPITAVSHLHALDAMLPNSTLHVIPEVGHLIHYEVPRVAAQLIRDFVGEGELAD